MKRISLLIWLQCSAIFLYAQQDLSLQQYLAIVKKYHPVMRQAALDVEIAKANITSARGGFDPLLTHETASKKFGGLLYYNDQLTELQIPTWYGITVSTGLQYLDGERTAIPETKGSTSYFGFSLPVAKGLLLDKRRADLQRAKIFTDLSVQERIATLNDLLYDATKAYWNWWQQYQTQLLFQQAIANAEERFRLVKIGYRLGDRPAIDTTEALAQLQSFQQREAEIVVSIATAQLEASVYLWTEEKTIYDMPATVVPELSLLPLPIDSAFLLQQIPFHPELQAYQFKLNALTVDRRLKAQSLLPSVYLKYNQLNKSHDLTKSFSTPWLQNDYKYGVAFSLPLRLSEGRGEYRKAKLKIEQTELARLNKQVQLQNKVQQSFIEWSNVRVQIDLQQRVVQSYVTLQKGEEFKLMNGESSLFLVNARELKTLESQQKLIDLRTKEQKAAAAAWWSSGILPTL